MTALTAPAKVNLSLRVLGRRDDGYHELDTVMARLELADLVELTVSPAPGPDRLETRGPVPRPPGFTGPDNLALRAVRAYRRRAGWPEGAVTVRLTKNIPLAAGLGGGSSDAAAVLGLLNRAAPRPLADLAEAGLSLGADVPFFLGSRPLARARGVGEKLSEAAGFWQAWRGRELLLLNPGFQLSTADVFRNLGLTNQPADNNLGPALEIGRNDLLAPALRLAPEAGEALAAIRDAAPGHWGLSGSGPTFWLYRPARSLRLRPGWRLWETAIA